MKFLLLAVPFLFSYASVYANDSAVAEYAGQFQFVHDKNIAIQKELLEFTSLSQMMTEIKVTYLMRNRSEHSRTINVAFPLPDENLNESASNPPEMHLIVEGKIIDGHWRESLHYREKEFLHGVSVKDAVKTDDPKICEQLKLEAKAQDCVGVVSETVVKRMFFWKYTFPPNADIKVVHTYQVKRGAAQGLRDTSDANELFRKKSVVGGKDPNDLFCLKDMGLNWKEKLESSFYFWTEYVLKTGANWAGPIKDFELVVHRRKGEIVSTCFPGLKKTGENEFRTLIKEFTPTADILIGYFQRK